MSEKITPIDLPASSAPQMSLPSQEAAPAEASPFSEMVADEQQKELGDSPYEGMNPDRPAWDQVPTSYSSPIKARLMALALNKDEPGIAEETIKKMQEAIDLGQEGTIREQISTERANQMVAGIDGIKKDLKRFDTYNEDVENAVNLARNTFATYKAEQDRNKAMEEAAIERLQDMAATHPIQAGVLMGLYEKGDSIGVLEQSAAKQARLLQLAEKFNGEYGEESWAGTIYNFIASAIPFNYLAQRSDIVEGVSGWSDVLAAGNNMQAQSEKLLNMPYDEFMEYTKDGGEFEQSIRSNATDTFHLGFDPATAAELVRNLSALSDDDRQWTNFWGAVDTVTAIPLGKVGNVYKAVARTGARREAVDMVIEAMAKTDSKGAVEAAKETGIKAADLDAAVSVKAANPAAGSSHAVATGVDVATREKAAREALSEVISTAQEQRLRPDELNSAYLNKLEEFTTLYGEHIKDYERTSETLSAGQKVNKVEVVYGRKGVGGFVKESTLIKSLEGNGLTTNNRFIAEDGMWYAKVEFTIPEYGFAVNKLHAPTQRFLSIFTGGPWRSAARLTDEGLFGKAVASGAANQKQMRDLGMAMKTVWKSLDGKGQEAVSTIAAAGSKLGKWFSREEFDANIKRAFSRESRDVEWEAYTKLQTLNDMEFVLRKDSKWLEEVVQGKETVTFKTKWNQAYEESGIVNWDPKQKPSSRMYNVSDNEIYSTKNPISQADFEKKISQGYVTVKIPSAIDLPTGIRVDTILIKKSDLTRQTLKKGNNILGYSEGGHRMYTNKYFGRQTSWGVQGDDMSRYLKAPNTFVTGATIAEVKAWANQMNTVREFVRLNPGVTPADLERTFDLGVKGIPSGEEFLNGVKNGIIDLKEEFVANFDRELPEVYTKTKDDITYLFDVDETGFNNFSRTVGKMYTSRKGDILPDTAGNLSEVVDPFKALETSLRNVTRQTGLFNYKFEALQRYNNTYHEWLDLPEGNKSDYFKFKESKIKEKTPEPIRKSIEKQKESIEHILGFSTVKDRVVEQAYRHVAEWVIGDSTDSALRKSLHDAVWWTKDANPVNALRSFAFDLKLGMFNPGQLVIQASTMASAIALSPRHGLKGAATLSLHPYIVSGSENLLNTMAKRGMHKAMGFASEEDFKFYARHLRNSGFADVNGGHLLISETGPTAYFSSFKDGANSLREKGRFFFYTAETWNKLVAYRIGWEEALAKGLKPGQDGFDSFVARVGSDYSFNMERESAATFQKGLFSIPTQFWAYNLRMMDAMLGSRFTAAQKARLIAVNAALYGASGNMITEGLSEYLENSTGTSPDIDTPLGIVNRGMVDALTHYLTGADVNIGERMGTGGFVGQVYKDLFGLSEYGEKTVAEMLGGATASIAWQAGKSMKNALYYTFAETGADMGDKSLAGEEWQKLAGEISTVSNFTKAIYFAQYGLYKSKKGTTLSTANQMPEENAWFFALGFTPGAQNQANAQAAYLKHKDEVVKETASQLRNWRTEAHLNPDKWEENAKKANALINLVPNDIRKEVLKRTNSTTPQSFYDYMGEKYEKELREEAANNNDESENKN